MDSLFKPVSNTSDEADVVTSKITFWKRLLRHRIAIAGFVVLTIMMLAAIFAPLLAGYDPNFIDNVHWQGNPLPPCFQDAALCGGHWLGTDEVGRDLWARLLYGARVSYEVGILTVIIEIAFGTLLGAIAGYYGGWIDYFLMRVTDVFLSIPLLPLIFVLTAIVAASSSKAALGFQVIVIIIAALSWPNVARLVRASYLSLREREYAEAAKAVGNGDLRIIFRHLLPNAVAPIVVQATLDVAGVITLESTLSYFGFGIQPPTASWGNMLSSAQANLQIAWWAAVFPGLCILLTVLSINYIGDGLRDALDPNMK